MSELSYPQTPLPVRQDLLAAQQRFWQHLASPGTWLTAGQKVTVAAEVRNAENCSVCVAQKAALSPNMVKDRHESLGELDDAMAEVVHRVVGDPGRLSEGWVQGLLDGGLEEGAYIEISGLVATMMIMDTFAAGIGHPKLPLPEPQEGEPSRYWPSGARKQAAFVSLIEPEDIADAEADLYPMPEPAYIHRALTAVPETKRAYWDLAVNNYLPPEHMRRWDTDCRAISRNQIELIAARTSALHQCAY